MARRETLILLIMLSLAAACQSQDPARVKLAVAIRAQAMGIRLDSVALDSAEMPASWALDGWLRTEQIREHQGWVLICPLDAGEAVALDCLRPPPPADAREVLRAVEAAERIWPGQSVGLVNCGDGETPGCGYLGETLVLDRPMGPDDQGRISLALRLSPTQEALAGPRLFALTLPPGSGEGEGFPAASVADLLDLRQLRRLHHERMHLLKETLRTWGRVLPDTAEVKP